MQRDNTSSSTAAGENFAHICHAVAAPTSVKMLLRLSKRPSGHHIATCAMRDRGRNDPPPRPRARAGCRRPRARDSLLVFCAQVFGHESYGSIRIRLTFFRPKEIHSMY